MSRAGKLLRYAALSAGALLCAYPFLWMLGTALEPFETAVRPALSPWPLALRWENLGDTFAAAPFARYFLNSFLVGAAVTLGVVFTSVCAGYAFARLEFPGRGLLFALVLATLMVPFEITLIPNFVLISRAGWYDHFAALIVPWTASAFGVFLLRQAFLGLPRDYYDAAVLDGCGHFRFLWRIGVPLVRPAVITAALFAFLGSYSALLWPLVVTGSESMRVVQVGLMAFYSDAGIQIHLLMCASAIVILPTVFLYFAAQRYFVESATSSGIKS